MAPSLTRPQGHLSPGEALQLAQQAPTILKSNLKAISTSPLSSLFSAPETADLWVVYENLLLACLRAGDDQAAIECLDRLTLRFGSGNEKIMALTGLSKEATAESDEQLKKILKDYEEILEEDKSNIPIAKRRVALLRSLGKTTEAIQALTSLLETSPTDAEGWSELADLYLSQGIYAHAIFALEEVLVLCPNAWNMQARLGEVLLMASSATGENQQKHLAESLKRFCRSIELCDDYLRGYYGLRKVTDQILEGDVGKSKKQPDEDVFAVPDQKTVEKLNQTATAKLSEIVRRNMAGESLWQGYDAGEVAAAKELLDKSKSNAPR